MEDLRVAAVGKKGEVSLKMRELVRMTPEERQAIETELSEDANLLRELNSLKRVDDLYKSLPPVKAPDELEDRIREGVRRLSSVVESELEIARTFGTASVPSPGSPTAPGESSTPGPDVA